MISAPTLVPPKQTVRSRAPLSSFQEAIWTLDQTHTPHGLQNLSAHLSLRGAVCVPALEESLQRLLDRHEVLRTSYQWYEFRLGENPGRQRLVQLISNNLQINLTCYSDLVGSYDNAVQRMRCILRDDLRKTFDLARPPLIRATLIRLAEGEDIFVLTAHPIIIDRRSFDILFYELGEIYSDVIGSGRSTVPDARKSYLDFATVQRQKLKEDAAKAGANFWKACRERPASTALLPNSLLMRTEGLSYGTRQNFEIERLLQEDLVKICAAQGIGLSALLVTAFAILLTRYTGEEHLGLPFWLDKRSDQDCEGVAGPFCCPLPLQLPLQRGDTFTVALQNVAQVVETAFANIDAAPHPEIEAAYQHIYFPSSMQIRVSVATHDRRPQEIRFTGLRVGDVHLAADHEVVVTFYEHDEEASGSFLVPDGLDSSMVQRMLEQFKALLASIAADPRQLISCLSALTHEEEKAVEGWNRTDLDYPRESCLYHGFEDQTERRPNAIAAVYDAQQMTYRELNEEANRLARHLRSLGVQADTLVGIYLRRSLNMLVAMVAVVKAGGAYVPLDPSYPAERIAFMLEDCGKPLVITEEVLIGSLPPYAMVKLVLIDGDWAKISQYDAGNLRRASTAGNLAYVIHTSGSTGRPKGVMITHQAVVNFMESMRREPGLEENDIMLAVTTLSFDIAELEFWLPLCVGARVVIASRDVACDGAQLMGLLGTAGTTVMQATPATWRLLLDAGWSGDARLKILCGGEALSPGLAAELLPKCKSLWNMYGPTETTIWSCLSRVETGLAISLGRPIANTQVYILDEHGKICPVGALGELCIGGDGVARGYLNRPELTAEKFVADPFNRRPGSRLYRTGDLARYLPDGRIEFQGRLDHQVKVRGYRIELGEIESVLSHHPAVADCLVLAREDVPGSKRLVAYVVARSGRTIVTSDLRRALREKLTDYMVPSFFVSLPALPRTPAGKVDRRNLPAPEQERPEMETLYVAPRTATEKKLTLIWQSVLGIKKIGVTDNYFDLGAESLMTARVFARITREFGRQISPTALFEAPTVEQLSQLIGRVEQKPNPYNCLVPIRTTGTRFPLFCIHGGAGSILFYYKLASYLSHEQPVYALQSRGLYGDAPPHTEVQEMARWYLREIRTVQPQGPYHFVGYCFGMIVAYEIAQMLLTLGEQVALVASINGPAPNYQNGPGAGRTLDSRGILARMRWGIQWRFKRLTEKARTRLIEHRRTYCLSRNLPLPAGLRDMFFRDTNAVAERNYKPLPYPGRVAIFRAKGVYHDPDLGWRQFLTGDLDVYDIPGKHYHHRSIVDEPIVRDLANTLETALHPVKAGAHV
jgi:surfactin family lipopeptide synthetase A